MAIGRVRTVSSGSEYEDHYSHINDKPVDDISLEFFYKPHTITLLTVLIIAVFYFAFTRDDSKSLEDNLFNGFLCVLVFFLFFSILAFPNGPFTRPHPAVWRIVFGISVMYCMILLFLLFQKYETIKKIAYWFDPKLENFHIDMEKDYAVNCSDITVERIWGSLDIFAFAHFFGWAMKALLVRHYGILWTISVMWEITEVAFAHLLPNFAECWWDALVLDVLVCNGLGIYFGMVVCKKLEIRSYKWESIRDIRTTGGKIRRAVLQFTPASWTHVRWLDPHCTYMRFIAVSEVVVFWQIVEMNTFFLKHIFEFPSNHPLVIGRIFLISSIVAPTLRQYYIYVTDPRCTRVGLQCWVFGAIIFTEAMICIKFGSELFARAQIQNILLWLTVMLAASVLCVYFCVIWAKYKNKHKMLDEESDEDETVQSPSRVSFQNHKEHNLRSRKRVLNGSK